MRHSPPPSFFFEIVKRISLLTFGSILDRAKRSRRTEDAIVCRKEREVWNRRAFLHMCHKKVLISNKTTIKNDALKTKMYAQSTWGNRRSREREREKAVLTVGRLCNCGSHYHIEPMVHFSLISPLFKKSHFASDMRNTPRNVDCPSRHPQFVPTRTLAPRKLLQKPFQHPPKFELYIEDAQARTISWGKPEGLSLTHSIRGTREARERGGGKVH